MPGAWTESALCEWPIFTFCINYYFKIKRATLDHVCKPALKKKRAGSLAFVGCKPVKKISTVRGSR
jgi:hypothetical protein